MPDSPQLSYGSPVHRHSMGPGEYGPLIDVVTQRCVRAPPGGGTRNEQPGEPNTVLKIENPYKTRGFTLCEGSQAHNGVLRANHHAVLKILGQLMWNCSHYFFGDIGLRSRSKRFGASVWSANAEAMNSDQEQELVAEEDTAPVRSSESTALFTHGLSPYPVCPSSS